MVRPSIVLTSLAVLTVGFFAVKDIANKVETQMFARATQDDPVLPLLEEQSHQSTDTRELFRMGYALTKKSQFEAALPLFKRAAELAPGERDILYTYAWCLTASANEDALSSADRWSRREKARKIAQAAQLIDPLNADVKDLLSYLEGQPIKAGE